MKAVDIIRKIKGFDWVLLFSILPITVLGMITMSSFTGKTAFFEKQLIWLVVSLIVFFSFSLVDWRFMRRTKVIVTLFLVSCFLLSTLFIFGKTVKGSQSWFDFGFFSFQPSDPIKIVLILLLAKYFSRRHVEIAHIRHIIVSGFYAFVLFLLIFLQPDFGSAIMIFFIWFGMVLVSGISKKHLLLVFIAGAVTFGVLWSYVFQDYQKDRILTFIHPLADIQGAGYNAYQSTIAVGSGQLWGKGVGFGTQSRLNFLPEYETDFIFAAFAEEWGFIGVMVLFTLYGIVMWRIIRSALQGATNFETLFGIGLAILIISHFLVHVGMNIGMLPVTGVPLPFMSYGGTHLLMLFSALGVLSGMNRYSRTARRDVVKNEIVGI